MAMENGSTGEGDLGKQAGRSFDAVDSTEERAGTVGGDTIVGVLTIAVRLVEHAGEAKPQAVSLERMERTVDPVAIAITRVIIRSRDA